jgi:hypothetical protein
LGVSLFEIAKRIVDVDRLIIMPLLSANRLSVTVNKQRGRMTQGGDLKIKWNILTEAMDIVDNKSLISPLKMIKIVYLDNYCLNLVRIAEKRSDKLL